ncbi:MAG: 50S ribosomal protein L15 [Clostridiales bacterium]|nr:50S ribosomal protein L15 [Clostridiales bacterium]
MRLNTIKSAPGSRKSGNRVGRGIGCGTGKTCGRGHKGQHSRSGGFHKVGFEGGQMPLYLRLPKRGFSNARFKKHFAEVNVGRLNDFRAGSVITPEKLIEAGIIKKVKDGVKIMGSGELTKKLNISAHKFTKGATAQIEAAGGSAKVI